MEISNEIDLKVVKKVIKALEKKAVGYETEDVVEEYVKNDQDKPMLVKKKVSRYYVPADISATKLLLELFGAESGESFVGLSDEQLNQEAIKLFKEFKELSGDDFNKSEDLSENDQNI